MPNKLDHLLNVISEPAFQATLRGDLVYVNEEMGRLIGLKPDAEGGRTVFGLGLFQNHAEYRGFIRGFNTVGPLQRIRLPSAKLRDQRLSVVLNAVLFEDGDERYVIGIMRLKEPKDYFVGANRHRDNWDQLPYYIFQANGDGQFLYANARMSAFLDIEHETTPEKYNLRDVDLDFSDQHWREALVEVRRNGEYEYETQFRRPNGTVLPVCVTMTRVEGVPPERVTLAAHSMALIRKLESDLRAMKLELIDADRKRERDVLQQKQSDQNAKNGVLIVSESKSYRSIFHLIDQVGPTDSTVLITGETGTGKELIAKSIHAKSQRSDEPFVVVNCGALPKNLIESELFGHKKGSFTGATRDQVGRFKLADEGTLFLDEVGEMPLSLQTRLLRFLQEGEFTPIGSQQSVFTNVRVVAATNRDLEKMVRDGDFRADLFFRLNVFPIHNIPLRDRKEDLPFLLDHFIEKHSRRLNRKVSGYEASMLEALRAYSFPGNVRELENIVERALIIKKGDKLSLDWDLTSIAQNTANMGADAGAGFLGNKSDGAVLTLEEMQRRYIEAILERTGGKVSGAGGAAELLGVKAQTLFSKMKKLAVER